ncbi:hypothetical protein [Hyphomonas sp. CACIAM 19H1]|uniref:hypothetical protein n=1 Tax=Hyphomonas sp. CACIAM 19H1 TaxID=1873716 RepID=UPI0013B05D1B|nr:hypothetical protein [Hyphomonas sp. CACIAM 19H1]
MIETARMQSGSSTNIELNGRRTRIGDSVSVSPAGGRFVSAVVRGNIGQDRVEVDIITARLDDLYTAADVRVAARVSALARGNTDILLTFEPMFSWLNEDTVAFRWESGDGSTQVFRLDLSAEHLTQVTAHDRGVTFFRFHSDGTIIYQVPAPPEPPSPSLLRTGGLVESVDAYVLAQGEAHATGIITDMYNRRWFLQRAGESPRHIDVSGMGHDVDRTRVAAFSPDGRYLVVAATPAEIPATWDAYRGGYMDVIVKNERVNPRTGLMAIQLQQYYLIDVATGEVRTALDAPVPLAFDNVFWSPDSTSFLVGPTYLPFPTDEAGVWGRALIEIDPYTLERRILPTFGLSADRRSWDEIRWVENDTVLVREGQTELLLRRSEGQWSLLSEETAPLIEAPIEPPVRVEARQDANTPPVLFAVDARAGTELLIYDPNPGLVDRFSLGHVEHFEWAAGPRTWSGMLYYPAGYEEGRRYPLVLQTHGHGAPSQFSLNGMGGSHPAMGPGVSIYVAQPLAGRGMFVLQMEDQGGFASGREELEAYMSAYAAAIGALDDRGFISPDRVGISGFSRTGWHVLYALTHTDIPFAAAIASDNIQGGYSHPLMIPGSAEFELGSAPYGTGLKNWLEMSPSFSVERLRTPLRLQAEGAKTPSFLLSAWEFFSRARHTGLPVEFNLAPDVLNGSHLLQNPAQTLAIQQGAVEWFDYWLNGVLPADGEKRSRQLRKLKHLNDLAKQEPRPPLLDWQPVSRP